MSRGLKRHASAIAARLPAPDLSLDRRKGSGGDIGGRNNKIVSFGS